LLVGVGAWLYQSNLFPQERKLSWAVGTAGAAITQVELQIWSPEGELLKREMRAFPRGAPSQLEQTLALKEGRYEARYVIERASGPQEAGVRPLEVSAEKTYFLSLGRP